MRKRTSKNGPGAIKPAMSARIRELVDEGKKPTEIARALGGKVSRQAVSGHCRKLRLDVAGKGPPATASTKVALPKVAAAADRLLRAPMPDDIGLPDLERRLRSTTQLANQCEPLVITGVVAASTHVAVVRLEGELAERVETLRPKPPPDPEADPVNKEATEKLMRRLGQTIAAQERQGRWLSNAQLDRLCPVCRAALGGDS